MNRFKQFSSWGECIGLILLSFNIASGVFRWYLVSLKPIGSALVPVNSLGTVQLGAIVTM